MQESTFRPSEWVLVVDTDAREHSAKQVEVCKAFSEPIKGAIFCNKPEFADADICTKIPAFPSFCNASKNVCAQGLRVSDNDFAELQAAADQKEKGAEY